MLLAGFDFVFLVPDRLFRKKIATLALRAFQSEEHKVLRTLKIVPWGPQISPSFWRTATISL
jgi:hypothetical protein